MLKWADSKAATFKQNNILIQVRSQHAAEVADNRKYLKIMIENVLFLANQRTWDFYMAGLNLIFSKKGFGQ